MMVPACKTMRVLTGLFFACRTQALNNGVGITPPMGWSRLDVGLMAGND
jgi:hypothetical protein